MSIEQELMNRANSQCELCGATNDLTAYEVPCGDGTVNSAVLVCGTCNEQLNDDSKIDESHWHCLNDAMWSELDAVKVVSYHMLHKLNNQDLIDMMYFEDDVKQWADKGLPEVDEEPAEIKKDANGVVLNSGDSVTVLKDLDVKGSHIVAKRGTVVKNIRMCDVAGHIEGKITGTSIFLKCEFIKKL